ncbi:MAG: HNH endonuclease [bacterium]
MEAIKSTKTKPPSVNVLVLNASYEVLNITRWQRAVCLIYMGKAEIVEHSDLVVHSPRREIRLPSVIRMVYYIKMPRLNIPFSRTNVFMRDRFTCQYCGTIHQAANLTLDHVIPRSHGGTTCWENVVTACRQCNIAKGDCTPDEADVSLIRNPKAPHYFPVIHLHFREEWSKYIPYAIPLPKKKRASK